MNPWHVFFFFVIFMSLCYLLFRILDWMEGNGWIRNGHSDEDEPPDN